jgi:hypothetical protein
MVKTNWWYIERLVWLIAGKDGEWWAQGPIGCPQELEFDPATAEALLIIEKLDREIQNMIEAIPGQGGA